MTTRPRRTEAEVRYARIVGRNVAAMRKAHRMSREQLADKLRAAGLPINNTSLFRIENGRSSGIKPTLPAVTVDQLMAFATIFGCTVVWLLTEQICQRCHGAPPQGFACQMCGAGAEQDET